MSQLDEVVLVERVVGRVEEQPAALDERSRILLADEAIAQLVGPFPVRRWLDTAVGHRPELADHSQCKNAERRHPLLAVDDEELAIVSPFDNQGPHIVTVVTPTTKLQNVIPEVFPLLLRPRVIALVRRHTVPLAVTDQLQVVDRSRIEDVGPAHHKPL